MALAIAVDMNLSPDWIPVLVAAGHTAGHWSTVGDPRALDPELMDWARANAHIMLTHDLDFGELLAQSSATGPSVVIVRAADPDPANVGTQVLAALEQHAAELVAGALVSVDVRRSRVRVLPIN
jgi:predicted nuclease of predicted toxin-antitoxin system